ncbi:putative membrane protein [Dysgonomonas hofstadii]|uniref:Putative membrane protein n=1 Tax=Dysgonomonas hofstadii TaxID=637886 RepID=A0A840CPT8_9BACT|nr:hypothetical protein [Dysgonomonas hofstadii]MBB4037426.1 putative membrane protein [Dysgonomonas hofstadii]
MQNFKVYFFYFAIIGWILSLIVHIISVYGIDLMDRFPYVWLLHIAVFIAWLPAILYLVKDPEIKEMQKNKATPFNPMTFLKIIFKNTPVWLMIVAGIGFIYTIINFAWFFYSISGVPGIINGEYVLHNHGSIIKTLTEQEYSSYQAFELRSFSGHWIAFFGFASAILYPYDRKNDYDGSVYEQ